MPVQDIEIEKKALAKEYKDLLRISYQSLNKEDKKLIRKAFDYAVDAHQHQRRKSGEAYIFHPISVAKIVASEIGLDAISIASALIHDVVEDNSDHSLEKIEKEFGKNISKIVDGLTKIGKLNTKGYSDVSIQAENYRKMLLTLNDDVRVIIIKIADRLHNMQTLSSMPYEKQIQKASETLYIYAPLAHRIGLYNIKNELEDLGLKYTDPETYDKISKKLIESKKDQDEYIDKFNSIINSTLTKEKLKYSIKGRTKSIFSIKNKMTRQGISFEEVYDKFAVRIVYKSKPENEKFIAWKIYSIVTDNFTPNPTRLRDWISAPKSTGYEALHITVVGPKSRWVEVQIRSERMDEIAEKGYAAHYKYKQKDSNDNLDTWINKLQEALENPETNAVDFVEQFKLNLYSKEIFVFTPSGDLKSLPKGATPLDFAFAIHTEVGLKTRGAKVNGKLVPLNRKLSSGDRVEILTSEKIKPNSNWLDYATTARAKSKIKATLNEEKKLLADEGKEILKRKLKHLKINFNDSIILELQKYFKLSTSQDLFYRVGINTIDNEKLKKFISNRGNKILNYFKKKISRKKEVRIDENNQQEITSKYDSLVFGNDEEKLDYKLAACCNPIPGDKVFGFITINDGIKIHKKNCPNSVSLQSNYDYRIIKAKWIDSSQEEFTVNIEVLGIDKMGLVNNITKVISENMNINMKRLNFESDSGIFKGNIILSVKSNKEANKLIQKLKILNGIDKIKRK
ncbi:MAG: RelA/SpoT family protein [Flavobacteriaceae bacterium]|nr:bifunctional (p)ppGpp synthetase/guanosine-3',5'-bis(diphosphate) 3'-pyrophosphohydrolase [Flavobacteriaceae bacterium]